jgi:hypothetical protein
MSRRKALAIFPLMEDTSEPALNKKNAMDNSARLRSPNG